jgi:hypothetical protein
MKSKFLLVFIVSILFLNAKQGLFAQTNDRLNKRFSKIETEKHVIQTQNPYIIYLPMEFTGSQALKQLNTNELERIKSVSLVYTQFKLSETFDQYQLNMQRMETFFSMFPSVKANKTVSYFWIGQTGCTDPVTCKSYFHGFEIQLYTEEERIENVREDYLMHVYADLYSSTTKEGPALKLDSLCNIKGSGISKACDTIQVAEKVQKSNYGQFKFRKEQQNKIAAKLLSRFKTKELEFFVFYAPQRDPKYTYVKNGWTPSEVRYVDRVLKNKFIHRPARIRGKEVAAKIRVVIRETNTKTYSVEAYYHYIGSKGEDLSLDQEIFIYRQHISCYYLDSGFRKKSVASAEQLIEYIDMIRREPVKIYPQMNLVGEVLERNKQWKNCVVVTDVTGSMYPYLGQFLAWHNLNLKTSKNSMFVFFNDGDNMSDRLKVSGRVGGLYKVATSDFEKLNETLAIAKGSGGGGDAEENDIEASIFALNTFENAEGIILIADNYSAPRDMELLHKVRKPIHVIVCGAEHAGINSVYLDLVKKNGGSIHTIEEDLTELAKFNEGEIVKIGNIVYKIINGKFVRQYI